MGHLSVPADGRDPAALVEVGLARFELHRFPNILRDIQNQDFCASAGKKRFAIWVEFQRVNWCTWVDLGG